MVSRPHLRQLCFVRLQQLWEGYDPSTSQVEFASWLPTFFDDLLGSVRVEAKWAASHLPEQFPQAVLQLVATLFSRIDKSFRSRTDAALDSGGPSFLSSTVPCSPKFFFSIMILMQFWQQSLLTNLP